MSTDINKTLDALDLASFDCRYCDVRIEDTTTSLILYRNFELESCELKPSLGAFVRVFNNGKWFYCATTALDRLPEAIRDLIRQSRRLERDDSDPFSAVRPLRAERMLYPEGGASRLGARKKMELCESYFDTLRRFPKIAESRVLHADTYKVKRFRSSRGVEVAHDYNLHGLRFDYTLKEGDRIFYDLFDKGSDRFEDLRSLEPSLVESIEESSLFLRAKPVPPGQYRVLMGGKVVGVFAHESFGHKSEADFMLGDETAMKDWRLGSKVGADILSIIDDPGHAGTSGYCPFDDEGTPGQKTYLIKNGVLSGRLHSRMTSHALGEPATGNARAVSFEFEPIVRMTCTYVEPGARSLEEIVSKVDLGIYAKDVKHGSGLSTFTIAPRKTYWIRDGKIAEPVLVSVISGSVFQTLKDVEAVAGDLMLFSTAFGGCGKMEQMPLPVAFGGPSMLVRGMQVS
ncbi:MAG: TldD/PmbA family protein [Elusimicrobiota bacterium]